MRSIPITRRKAVAIRDPSKIIENCKDKKPQNVTLKLEDLQLVLNIIQVCYNRQAFKINEMDTIGLIYNKLKIFITQATQQSNT